MSVICDWKPLTFSAFSPAAIKKKKKPTFLLQSDAFLSLHPRCSLVQRRSCSASGSSRGRFLKTDWKTGGELKLFSRLLKYPVHSNNRQHTLRSLRALIGARAGRCFLLLGDSVITAMTFPASVVIFPYPPCKFFF